MNMGTTTGIVRNAPKITSYPSAWPRDNRSRLDCLDGQVFIAHPERKPHRYDSVTKKWREVL